MNEKLMENNNLTEEYLLSLDDIDAELEGIRNNQFKN